MFCEHNGLTVYKLRKVLDQQQVVSLQAKEQYLSG